MAWGKKKKDKKAKVNVVPRPAPKPAAKAAPAKPGVKPIGPKLQPVTPGSHGKPGKDPKVNIHMLANAMVDGVQYKADTDVQVPASVFRAIGKSCVTQNTWKQIKAKGGIGSLHK